MCRAFIDCIDCWRRQEAIDLEQVANAVKKADQPVRIHLS